MIFSPSAFLPFYPLWSIEGVQAAEATFEDLDSVFLSGPTSQEKMAPAKILKDGAPFRASDSCGDFSEEFIADVLEAKMEAELGLGRRFACVDDLIADLLED